MTDFQTKWIKSGLLSDHGVEVIVFDRDIKGIREQHSRVGRHLPHWLASLDDYTHGYRIWEQGHANAPKIRLGSKKKRPRTPSP